MPKMNVSRTIKCPADRAYAVLADVASYRLFLPFVKESSILSRVEAADGRQSSKMLLRVRSKKFKIDESFASQVDVMRASRSLSMQSSDGPIKKLHASWTVVPIDDKSCEMTLKGDLSFKNLALQFLLLGATDFVVRKLFNAFEGRIQELYGVPVA